jgi:hypothetical protein
VEVEFYVKSDDGIRTLLMNVLKLCLRNVLVTEEELEFEFLLLFITDPHDLIDGEPSAVLKSDFLEGTNLDTGLDHRAILYRACVHGMDDLQDLELVQSRKIVIKLV